jgi:hypothetical protein
VFVVVVVVGRVSVTVVEVVDVVAVWYGDVTAALGVVVLMSIVGSVLGGLALVEVAVVRAVQVAVVDVVDVVTVGDRHMAASLAVNMVVAGVFKVGGGHSGSPFRREARSSIDAAVRGVVLFRRIHSTVDLRSIRAHADRLGARMRVIRRSSATVSTTSSVMSG